VVFDRIEDKGGTNVLDTFDTGQAMVDEPSVLIQAL
jgi:hypothetical protein